MQATTDSPHLDSWSMNH